MARIIHHQSLDNEQAIQWGGGVGGLHEKDALDALLQCKCPYSIKPERVLDAWNQADFLKMETVNVSLNKIHKNYTQLEGEIAALLGCSKGYSVVWIQAGDPQVEEAVEDEDFYQTVEQNLFYFL